MGQTASDIVQTFFLTVKRNISTNGKFFDAVSLFASLSGSVADGEAVTA